MHRALAELCQGGLLGDAEVLMFYTWRDSRSDIATGTLHGHSTHNSQNFDGTDGELSQDPEPEVAPAIRSSARRKTAQPALSEAVVGKAPKPQQLRGKNRKFHAYVNDDGKIVDSNGEPV
ncbi:hypothetical protein B0H14DRAFT_3892183 [Mycena olivaceomarginata]|nr:hypothetical protein B0H14DRAFT_3892183 [Mycena olivaceomarginata]